MAYNYKAFFGNKTATSTNKTLAAGAGSYALTGTAASVLVKRNAVAGSGSYALTGTAASLNHGWKVPAGVGAYNLTGTAATLLHAWRLSAGAGAYNLTGTDATLTKASGVTVAAGVGSYALTGTAATLLQVRKLIADSGIYLLTGTAATLTQAAVPAPRPRGLGFPGKRYVDLNKRKASFSRKYFDELMAAARAHEEVLRAAEELKESKGKTALVDAAHFAEDAIAEAERSVETAANEAALVRMRSALQGAASATRMKDVIAKARIAEAAAKAIFDEDEEEAIMLLLQ